MYQYPLLKLRLDVCTSLCCCKYICVTLPCHMNKQENLVNKNMLLLTCPEYAVKLYLSQFSDSGLSLLQLIQWYTAYEDTTSVSKMTSVSQTTSVCQTILVSQSISDYFGILYYINIKDSFSTPDYFSIQNSLSTPDYFSIPDYFSTPDNFSIPAINGYINTFLIFQQYQYVDNESLLYLIHSL